MRSEIFLCGFVLLFHAPTTTWFVRGAYKSAREGDFRSGPNLFEGPCFTRKNTCPGSNTRPDQTASICLRVPFYWQFERKPNATHVWPAHTRLASPHLICPMSKKIASTVRKPWIVWVLVLVRLHGTPTPQHLLHLSRSRGQAPAGNPGPASGERA